MICIMAVVGLSLGPPYLVMMDLHLIIFGDSSAGKLFLDECVSLQFVITF